MFAQAAYYLDACGRKGQNCHICHCIWELYSVTLSCKYKYKIFLLHLEAENSLSQDIYLHKYSLSSTNNILHIPHTIQDWSVTDVQNNTPVLDSHASNREWRKHLLLMITAVIRYKHETWLPCINVHPNDENTRPGMWWVFFAMSGKLLLSKRTIQVFPGTHLFTNPCLQMKHDVERSRKS